MDIFIYLVIGYSGHTAPRAVHHGDFLENLSRTIYLRPDPGLQLSMISSVLK